MKALYTGAELLYSATARCPCGAGMAYPLDHDDAHELSAWVCSRVLLGEVEIPDGDRPPSAGFFSPVTRVDAAGQEHHGLPFSSYSVKSEGQPSAQGASTRPPGAHVESEPHCRCRACGHEYVAARRRNDTQRNNEGMDCPRCGAAYLAAGGSLGTQIEVRSRTVVVPDGEVAPVIADRDVKPENVPQAAAPTALRYGPPDPAARSLADMVIGHVDRHAPHVTDSARADALALAFVDVAERVYPGGLAKGGTTGVDFEREGVMVRVVALEVPPAAPPREPIADPISDDELATLAAECEACPFDYAGDAPEARTWRNLHRAVIELRAARSPSLPAADLARAAFEAYGASTGGKTWDGKDIPPFDVIRERTPHVAAAWEAAAEAVRKLARS